MYTKLEEYYMIIFRKSTKSYRANNYKIFPIEFKTYDVAEQYLLKHKQIFEHDENYGKCAEAIIVKFTNEPIKTIKLNNGQNND